MVVNFYHGINVGDGLPNIGRVPLGDLITLNKEEKINLIHAISFNYVSPIYIWVDAYHLGAIIVPFQVRHLVVE